MVCLISGGASALLPAPAPPITLEEKQAVTRLLLACGANIHEINAVRKHISRIKGGQLARLAAPARVESLLLSDVIGDDLDVIGSGPTAPDASTFAGAAAILEKYGITRPRARERPRAHSARGERRNAQARRSAVPPRAQYGGRQQSAGARCGRAARARAGLPHAGARQRDRRRDARDRAHARRHRARDGAHRPARAAARLHHHRGRDDGHAARAKASADATRSSCSPPRSTSPVCPGRSSSAPARTAATDPPTPPAPSRTARRLRRNPDARAISRRERLVSLLRSARGSGEDGADEHQCHGRPAGDGGRRVERPSPQTTGGSTGCSLLEVEAQRELNLPRGAETDVLADRRVEDAERSARDRRRIGLAGLKLVGCRPQSRSEYRWRIREIRVVEQVVDSARNSTFRFSSIELL